MYENCVCRLCYYCNLCYSGWSRQFPHAQYSGHTATIWCSRHVQEAGSLTYLENFEHWIFNMAQNKRRQLSKSASWSRPHASNDQQTKRRMSNEISLKMWTNSSDLLYHFYTHFTAKDSNKGTMLPWHFYFISSTLSLALNELFHCIRSHTLTDKNQQIFHTVNHLHFIYDEGLRTTILIVTVFLF